MSEQPARYDGRPATFSLPWPPALNAAYRSVTIKGRARLLLSASARAYKAAALHAVIAQGVPSFGSDRVSVEIAAYPPDRRRRDLDGLLKLSLDALMPRVIADDSQIDRLLLERREVRPGGELIVSVSGGR
jgi:crossover junction endodeoxyribonuclease RusA